MQSCSVEEVSKWKVDLLSASLGKEVDLLGKVIDGILVTLAEASLCRFVLYSQEFHVLAHLGNFLFPLTSDLRLEKTHM